MKKLISVVICLFVSLTLSGCILGYKFTKDAPPPEPVPVAAGVAKKPVVVVEEADEDIIIIKMGKKRGLRAVLNELLADGELFDKDVYGRLFGEYEYTWELLLIKGENGDFQAATIENGILIEIEPVKDMEDARKKYKPYGGWRK